MTSSGDRRREDPGLVVGTRFFKIILQSTLRDKKLLIPGRMVRDCNECLPKSAILKVPSGGTWTVDVVRDEVGVWFGNGWEEFSEFHSLQFGHFLVFEYEGFSRFSVVICDRTAAEIAYPVRTNCEANVEEVEGSFDTRTRKKSESLIDVSQLQMKKKMMKMKMRGSISAGNAAKMGSWPRIVSPADGSDDEQEGSTFVEEMNNDNGGGVMQPPQPQSVETAKQKELMSARKKRRDNGGGENRKVNQEAPRTYRGNGSPFGRDEAEKSHIPSMAEQEGIPEPRRGNASTSSVNPSFSITISLYNMKYSETYLPTDFVLKHMKLEKSTMMVCGEDGSGPWSLSFAFRLRRKGYKGRGRGKFCGGWAAFRRDNSLKLGDVCRFELISSNEMEVTIQRN